LAIFEVTRATLNQSGPTHDPADPDALMVSIIEGRLRDALPFGVVPPPDYFGAGARCLPTTPTSGRPRRSTTRDRGGISAGMCLSDRCGPREKNDLGHRRTAP
jgi:hypothetical protein